MALISTCDLSLTGSFVSNYGEIPNMTGDSRAAGKLCVIWAALYGSQEAMKADDPVNSFIILCDTAKTTGQPQPSGVGA